MRAMNVLVFNYPPSNGPPGPSSWNFEQGRGQKKIQMLFFCISASDDFSLFEFFSFFVFVHFLHFCIFFFSKVFSY